ncbi:hypothetical protein V1264_009972 [Littorina saxatilis]|uniref:Uncharacterized protein n=1 Tax=Littorina saxatilis TaxID=31220 RepID=A0AAN9AN96_9CAEN
MVGIYDQFLFIHDLQNRGINVRCVSSDDWTHCRLYLFVTLAYGDESSQYAICLDQHDEQGMGLRSSYRPSIIYPSTQLPAALYLESFLQYAVFFCR